MNKLPRQSRISLAVALTLTSSALMAQTQQSDGLQSITVTAQKREQSLQDVPSSITAVTGASLERNSVSSIYNLQAVVPSLQVVTVDPPGQGTSIMLRGLGSSAFNMGFDPAVAVFVDGVSRSRSGLVAASDFLDLERIEVLKGPQGTLFGKNTTAGILQMISRKPDLNSRDGSASLSYESYNTLRVKGSINVPVSDTVAMRLAASQAKGDGWQTIQPTGEKLANLDRSSVKAQVLIAPTKDFSAHLIFDYANLTEKTAVPMRLINDPTAVAGNLVLANAVGASIVNPPNLKALRVDSNIAPRFAARDTGFSAELKWKLDGGMTLTSLTGSRNYKDSAYKDNDFTGGDVLKSQQDLPKVSLLSQEVRLSGKSSMSEGKSVDWMAGVYYSKENIKLLNDFLWGSQWAFSPNTVAFQHTFDQEIKSKAAFGHATLNMSPQWAVTGGVRHSSDDKSGSLLSQQPNALPLPVVNDYKTSMSESRPTGTLSLQFKPEAKTMVYGTAATGYKSGGISMTRDAAGSQVFFGGGACPTGTSAVPASPFCFNPTASSPIFDKETAMHYEVGYKADLAKDTIRLNVAAWSTSFKGLQMQTLRPDGSFAVVNAAGATSQGVEAESSFVLGSGLRANLSMQYADAKFNDDTKPLDGTPLAGKQLPFSSKITTGIGLSYTRAISDGWRMFGSGNLNYRSKYYNFTTPSPTLIQAGYSSLNLRGGVSNDKMEIALWCRNCTDKRATYSNFSLPFDGAAFGASTRFTHVSEPRFVGITATSFF